MIKEIQLEKIQTSYSLGKNTHFIRFGFICMNLGEVFKI